MAKVIGVGKAPQPPLSPATSIPLPSIAHTPTHAHENNLPTPFATTPNLSNNLSCAESILSEDLLPLTLTPSVRTTPCGLQNIAMDGITEVSEELLTPLVNSSTQTNLDSIIPGGNSLAMNNPTYHNLDVPQFLSFSDQILGPSSANLSDPRMRKS